MAAFEPGIELIVARVAAIARNFDGNLLRRTSPELILDFLSLAEKKLVPPVNALRSSFSGEMPEREYCEAVEEAISVLRNVERSLAGKLFILGVDISFADVGLFCALIDLFILVLDPLLRGAYPETTRWFETMLQQPEVSRTVGAVNLCPPPAEFLALSEVDVDGDTGVEDNSPAPQDFPEKSSSGRRRRRRTRRQSCVINTMSSLVPR